MMLCTDNTVLLLKLSSFPNRSLIIFSAGSMRTEVNNVATSQDVRYSPGRRVISLTLFKRHWYFVYDVATCLQGV